jgi:putative hemolysin
MDSRDNDHFRVDVEQVIRTQKNSFVRKLPRFIVKYIRHVVREKQLNEVSDYSKHLYGLDFIRKNMEFMNISYERINPQNIPQSGHFIFVCNHPLGGIDYYCAILSGSESFPIIKTIANEILLHVSPIKDLLIPVNVFGKNTDQAKEYIRECMESKDIQIMTFPAGSVARKINGILDDGIWNKSFIRYASEYKRDIIPVYIEAQNSKKFYRLYTLRTFLGIKTNLELFLLPQELLKQKNKKLKIYFGEPIKYQTFDDSKTAMEHAQYIKKIAYGLKNKKKK